MSTPPIDWPRVRAITLDLDDTLWPVWPTIEHAEARLRDWLDQHAPRAAALARDRAASHAARAAAHAAHPHALHDLSVLRRESIRHLLRAAGDDPALAEPAFEVFHAARQQVTLFDDALPALTALAARWPLVALSNGNADVHRVGIGQHFHASVHAAEVGAAKPDARIFAAAARAAGVPAAHVLHIGDDAELDVRPALASGMQAVWVNRARQPWLGPPAAQPVLTVAGLHELLARLHAAG